MLGLEITWSQKNYSARIVGDTIPPDVVDINSRLDSSTIAVVGQYNFLDKAFTPFVRAGLGSTYKDSNVASAPPQGTCWWHPWLGYICDTWQPTYDRNSFSYSAGLGLRADVNDAFWLELSYGTLWIDLSHGSTPDISGPRLNIGWLF